MSVHIQHQEYLNPSISTSLNSMPSTIIRIRIYRFEKAALLFPGGPRPRNDKLESGRGTKARLEFFPRRCGDRCRLLICRTKRSASGRSWQTAKTNSYGRVIMPARSAVSGFVPIQPILASFPLISQNTRSSIPPLQASKRSSKVTPFEASLHLCWDCAGMLVLTSVLEFSYSAILR